jgi:hypothetical protein
MVRLFLLAQSPATRVGTARTTLWRVRYLRDFSRLSGVSEDLSYGDTLYDLSMSAWHYWALTSEQPLVYSGSFHQAVRTDAQRQFLREYAIPHAIEKLVNKYPTVRFEAVESPVLIDFGSDTELAPGIRVTGDASIIPAFYWSGLLQRYSIPYSPDVAPEQWKDVTKLLADKRDTEHLAGWNRLRAGEEKNARIMLARTSGPLTTHATYSSSTMESMLNTITASRRMYSEYDKWFAPVMV